MRIILSDPPFFSYIVHCVIRCGLLCLFDFVPLPQRLPLRCVHIGIFEFDSVICHLLTYIHDQVSPMLYPDFCIPNEKRKDIAEIMRYRRSQLCMYVRDRSARLADAIRQLEM